MVRFILLLPILWLSLNGLALSQGDTKLRILHDHGNPVVSEMIELTIRGEYDLTVSLEEMTFPDSTDYDWAQIARDDWHKERVNGRLLQIFERKLAIFPNHAGEITIGPVTHHLTYVTDDGQRAETDVIAPAISLEVKPFPDDHRPLAAHHLELTDELSAQPGQLKQDEVLTRRVTIEAQGTMAHFLPPRPDLSQPWMISFTSPEIRETTITENGPQARVVWEWELRPRTGEHAVLPGIGFPWFDTEKRRIVVAPLKPIPFGIAGFGSNFGGSAQTLTLRNVAITATAVLAPFICGMGLLLGHYAPMRGSAILLRLRRFLPSPHSGKLRRAARQHDLTALRDAAEKHLRWYGLPVSGLAALDRQLFSPSPPADFDTMTWLTDFRNAVRREKRRLRYQETEEIF